MTPEANPIRAQVRAHVLQALQAQGRHEIGDDESLVEAGFLDSLSIFQLIAFLETTFGLRIADEEIVFERFGSVGAIVRTVQAKQGGPRGP